MDLLSPLRRLIRRTGDAIVTTLTTPISGDNTPHGLKPIVSPSSAEIAAQEAILIARKFHHGEHDALIGDRLSQFLGPNFSRFSIRVNFLQMVNRAAAARLIIEGFDSTAEGEQKQKLIEFAADVWAGSRMDGKRRSVLETVTDGEYFILIDYDTGNLRPRLTPHARYTDSKRTIDSYSGTGEGMYLVYPNDDIDQKPLHAIKRWVETLPDGKKQERATLYYPDRIERYAQLGTGWQLSPLPLNELEELPEVSPWLDSAGNALGIPVVHIKTPEMMPAALEAVPIQKAINKTFTDALEVSDWSFPTLLTLGWHATVDGTATGTPLPWSPGTSIGTGEKDASVQIVEGSDPARQIEFIQKQIGYMATVTNTPLSMMDSSGQVRAEGTLQEEKESFIAKVREYADTMGMGYSDALRIAARLENEFGAGGLDEEAAFIVKWAAFSTRSTADKAEEAAALLAVGVPEEIIWRRVFAFPESDIERMIELREAEIAGDGFRAPAALTEGN